MTTAAPGSVRRRLDLLDLGPRVPVRKQTAAAARPGPVSRSAPPRGLGGPGAVEAGGAGGIRTPDTRRCSAVAAQRLTLLGHRSDHGARGGTRTPTSPLLRRAPLPLGYSRMVVRGAGVEPAQPKRRFYGPLPSPSRRAHAGGARRGIRTPNIRILEPAPLPGWATRAIWYAGSDSNAQHTGSEPVASASWATRARLLRVSAVAELAEERGVEPPTFQSPRFSRPVAHHRAVPSASDDARGMTRY